MKQSKKFAVIILFVVDFAPYLMAWPVPGLMVRLLAQFGNESAYAAYPRLI